jgi:hypothetical protein
MTQQLAKHTNLALSESSGERNVEQPHAVELQATTEPHCSRGVQPGGIYVCVGTARADSRRSGVGLAPRPQALPVPAGALVLHIQLTAEGMLPMPAAALVPCV